MTWNVEGHKPIPEEEAMPQLCYIASGMMLAGLQKISRPRLAMLLQEAREALPAELGYVKGTVDQFIHRIEDRSSLLMMTGHDVEDGQLVEFFEFRHLTFQEFLTARAMVEGWHPNRKDKDTLVTVLESHLSKEDWREVIPLAAVLGGKATEELIQRLTQLVNALDIEERYKNQKSPVFLSLGHSLADEVVARPDTIRAAIRALVRLGLNSIQHTFGSILARGKYGIDLREEAERAFLGEVSYVNSNSATLKEVLWWQLTDGEARPDFKRLRQQFIEMISLQDTLGRCEGALSCASLLENVQ